MSYAGVYINLDRSTARRAAMEAQIARHGLAGRYRRFPAADGNVLGVPTALTDGEIGCLTSHYLVAKEHLGSSMHLHVVEDDAMFSSIMHDTICRLVSDANVQRYDLLFLDNVVDLFLQPGLEFLAQIKQSYDRCITRDAQGNIVGLKLGRVDYVGACTSYLINARSTGKLLSMYDATLAEGAKQPVDLLIRRKGREGALRVGCVFPFLTSVRLDEMETTITGRGSDARSIVAVNLLRHSFFVESDIGRLLATAQRLLPRASTDMHQRLLEHLLAFYISPGFKGF